jgi:hypothetical protein
VMLPCTNLTSDIAKFTLGLQITRGKGKVLAGTPLRFTLRKECNLNRGMMKSSNQFDISSSAFQGSVLIFMLLFQNCHLTQSSNYMFCATNHFRYQPPKLLHQNSMLIFK